MNTTITPHWSDEIIDDARNSNSLLCKADLPRLKESAMSTFSEELAAAQRQLIEQDNKPITSEVTPTREPSLFEETFQRLFGR